MTLTWIPSNGVTRRLLTAALAALLAFTALALIPGATPPADARTEWRTDYWITFADQDQMTEGPGTTVQGSQPGKTLYGITVYGTTLGGIHSSCSDRFNLYSKTWVRNTPLPNNWGYADTVGGSPSQAPPKEPRIWDFGFDVLKNGVLFKQCGNQVLRQTLTVIKVLDPSNDPGLFNLQIDGFTEAANVGDGGTTGAVDVATGSYTVGETAGTGTSLSDYTTVITGDCAADGSVTLAVGEHKTCTITNTNTLIPPPDPDIQIEKATNGFDADTPTGPSITVGDPVTWTYVVTNMGNVALSNVVVTDNKEGAICTIAALAVGASDTCTKTGTAVAGQYGNVGTATGDYNNVTVNDKDPSHYIGVTDPTPGIDIEKFTNDFNADTPTGPSITVGDQVTWKYVVTNTGNVALSNVVVTDNMLGTIAGPASGDTNNNGLLDTDETWTYQTQGTAVAGQYGNVGTATGGYNTVTVTDDDPSHYFGQAVGASGIIGDTVWSDENDNGVQDSGEKGIAGATVRLTLPDGTTITMNTNANGLYLFSGLEAGTYKSELILSSIPDPAEGSLKLTTPGSFTIQLAEGESFLDADFGVVAALPKTGISADRLALIALALLTAGGVAVLSTRRRKDDIAA